MRIRLLGLVGAVTLTGTSLAQTPKDVLPKRAKCIVDGTALTPGPQSVSLYVNGTPVFFCGAGCRERFTAWPEKYVKGMAVQCTVQPNFKSHMDMARRSSVNNNLYYLCCEPCVGWMRDKPHLYVKELRDPVSGKWFKVEEGSPKSLVKGQVYLFESGATREQFDREPGKYVVEFKRP